MILAEKSEIPIRIGLLKASNRYAYLLNPQKTTIEHNFDHLLTIAKSNLLLF